MTLETILSTLYVGEWLILQGNVNTRQAFNIIETVEPTFGFGIGDFNASLANFWAPMTDMLFSIRFNEFLTDQTRSIDITTRNNLMICAAGDKCNQTFFVPGGIENLSASLINHSESVAAEAFTAVGQQGFIFDFQSPAQNVKFDEARDCHIYTFRVAAWALCLSNIKSNELAASKFRFEIKGCLC